MDIIRLSFSGQFKELDLIKCPYCSSELAQAKAGTNKGVQRWRCVPCGRRYTPDGTLSTRASLKNRAVALKEQGLSMREIGRRLDIHHATVSVWIKGIRSTESLSQNSAAKTTELLGPRRTTIGEVAQAAGVAVSTVSNYLNGKGRMSESTRQEIKKKIDELNFTPSALARAIRERKTGLIGLIGYSISLVDDEGSIAAGLLAGIAEAADTARRDLHVYTGWPQRVLAAHGADLLSGHIDGLLWAMDQYAATDKHAATVKRVAAAGLPTVMLFDRDVPPRIGYVNADNILAMRVVVNHLVELGHSRIAYIGPTKGSNYQDRIMGFRAALSDHGLNLRPAFLCLLDQYTVTAEEVTAILNDWINLSGPPTALVCATDRFAIAAIEAAMRIGLRLPGDLAVTGFDDLPPARRAYGGITTIRQPFREMGRCGIERLAALIDGADVEECRVTLPTTLVVRHSTVPG